MITVEDSPQQFQPAYNPYVLVLSSDNDTQENFKIQLTVKDTTDTNNESTIGVFNYPVNPQGYVIADLSRVVRDSVSHDFELGLKLVSNCPNSIKRITVNAQEYYGSPPIASGAIETIGDASGVTTFTSVWNGALHPLDFQSFNSLDYVIRIADGAYISNYLTNFDVTALEMAINQNGYIYAIQRNRSITNTFENYITEVRYKGYNSSGTLLWTSVATVDTAEDFTTFESYMIRIPIGTYNLSQLTLGDLDSGTVPDFTNVAYYTIEPRGSLGSTQMITVNVVEYCDSPKVFRLHWLNRLGGFDAFNFDRYYVKNNTIQSVGYNKHYGDYSPTQGAWGYSKSDFNQSTLVKTSQSNYTIQTDWITESEAAVLEELMTSPVVYLENSPTELIAVNVLNTTYETRYNQKDKLIQVSLDIQYGYPYKSQQT